MTRTDLLAPYARNEPCWCGSKRKYKYCHGNHHPPSLPGAPLPPDREDSKWLSPSTSIANGALLQMMPGGMDITMPPNGPQPSTISYTNWEADLGSALDAGQQAMSIESLGRLRVEVLQRLKRLPSSEEPPSEQILEAVFQLAAHTVQSVANLARALPRPTILWNQELDAAQFMGRTLLLADHVLYPDRIFDALRSTPSSRRLAELARLELRNSELVASGIAIPVPAGVAMAQQGQVAQLLTSTDLGNSRLVEWVRSQLITEGPTAREAIFVRAKDDLALEPSKFWLHGRIDPKSVDDATHSFRAMMMHPYDSEYDYGPWISQVENSAVSAFVQRTNERLVAADLFGSEYVSASMFEARLLRSRQPDERLASAQAALWADVPELPLLESADLTKLLQNEDAVEDLRHQVRASLATARSDFDHIDTVTELAHQLDAASRNLQKTSRADRAWKAAIPGGLSTASMLIGGVTGGLSAVGLGAVGALATLAPFLGDRMNARRQAAYLFVAARRQRS